MYDLVTFCRFNYFSHSKDEIRNQLSILDRRISLCNGDYSDTSTIHMFKGEGGGPLGSNHGK